MIDGLLMHIGKLGLWHGLVFEFFSSPNADFWWFSKNRVVGATD